MIVKDWLKSKDIYERDVMIQWALRARIIITCTYIIIVIALVFLCCMPIFGKSIAFASNNTYSDRSLIIQIYYIYDVTKKPQYELTVISQFISLVIAAMIYTGIDNFLGLLVFHLCGQLDIMKNRLKYSHENFRTILKNSVMYHIRLLRYTLCICFMHCVFYNIYMSIYMIKL